MNERKNIWVTSDHHFGHKNIIRFCDRPFTDTTHMREEMIERHNSVVKYSDDVYFLGDFAFANETEISEILVRMNGNKHFIFGNHDRQLRKTKMKLILDQFVWMKDYHELKLPQPGPAPIILLHYPLYTWNRMHHGAFHFYGHTHGSVPQVAAGRGRDIGVDTNDYYPWNIWDLVKIMSKCEVTEPRHEDGKRK